MLVLPPVSALTNPVAEPMDATEPLLLVQVPPPGLLVNVCVVPTHIDEVPDIAVGVKLTVCVRVVKQPERFIR
jgi:hypothetical protein